MTAESTSITALVYGFIRDEEYCKAISFLQAQLLSKPSSRSALSLLGYCHFSVQDYSKAVEVYHKLILLHPNHHEYYYCMSSALLLSGNYKKAEDTIESSPQLERQERSKFLQAKIKFEKGDMIGSTHLLRMMEETPYVEIAHAAVLSMEGNFEEALKKCNHASSIIGFRPDVAYSMAYCHYQMEQQDEALFMLDEIISMAHQTQGNEDETVSTEHSDADTFDTSALTDTLLIETLNLKIAVEYVCGRKNEAHQTWKMMPIRGDEDIDAISLHNQAIINMDSRTEDGLNKLLYLINNPPFPSETFTNLILSYCKYGFDDQAADLIIENRQLLQLSVSTTLYDFLETALLAKTSTEEALRRFEKLSVFVAQNIRKLKKRFQDFKKRGDATALRSATKGINESMQLFVPILMTQTKIFWDRFEYRSGEKTLQIAEDICNKNESWQMNMAHIVFMQQGDRYNDAINLYADLIEIKKKDSLLEVSPIAIANLCVAYIMVKRNDEAETLLKLLQQQEEHYQYNNEHILQSHHSCIVNLVIGTLYCERGNFDFGIDRICKSLQPIEDKLGADTWYYAKLCLLALIDKMSKHMAVLSDRIIKCIHSFLDEVYANGLNTPAVVCHVEDAYKSLKNQKSISDEARLLKQMFLQL